MFCQTREGYCYSALRNSSLSDLLVDIKYIIAELIIKDFASIIKTCHRKSQQL